jgi:hypothetical protein
MQHERIILAPKLRDNELDTVSHQAADEMHVTAQAIKLTDQYRAFELSRCLKGSGELWAPV